jgi:ABC-type dipeptide/oligopeptide/nickel transport system ATPase component
VKIIGLQVENIKKLRAIEIRPDSNLVQITGRNGSGKTSLLDAIYWAIAGERNIQAEPIRRGAESALIKLDLGEFRVTRKFSSKEDGDYTTSLTVENEAGTRMDKPQNVLNAIYGSLTFDPLLFLRDKAADQFNTLKGLVPEVDFNAIAAADRADREERTTVNRRAKELRAQAEGIVLPPGKVPAKVDLATLEKKLGDAAEHNTLVERRKAQRQAVMDRCETRTREIAEFRDMIAKLEALQAEDVALLESAEALPEPIDVTQVRADLEAARSGNAAAALAEQKASIEARARAAEEESAALTKKIEKREEEKQAAIAKAKMPVDGLGFGDECILLDGLPFEQASGARQLRVSVAIAAALNPTLRIIRITDGSLLDKDAMAWLEKFADESDMQVWIELVGDGPTGFVIENGHLASDEPEEAV